ncbi:hypothetical protein, partial [Salmonella sp. s54412]|uniref:hypothetical protein n=1 Tax=Salmonella sp. s54412 TaxID=3160128 RepID=UPI003754A5B1
EFPVPQDLLDFQVLQLFHQDVVAQFHYAISQPLLYPHLYMDPLDHQAIQDLQDHREPKVPKEHVVGGVAWGSLVNNIIYRTTKYSRMLRIDFY